MRPSARILYGRGFAACGALLACLSLCGQQPAGSSSSASPETIAKNEIVLQPPMPKSPVDLFRNLLAMTTTERREFISKRPPETQKAIVAKIQEYTALQPEQRELRLRMTELRWYLLPLLNSSATNRTARLYSIPGDLRELVEARLIEWDKLSPEAQKTLLENESTIRFYFELAAHTPSPPGQSVTNDPGNRLESGIRRWQALPEIQRQEIVSQFRQFFDLTPSEKTKILGTLSAAELQEIEKTLRTFGSLSPAQRSQCVRSFQKFVSLSPEERQQFLKNAERWERMTPSERQTWRNLVSTLSRMPPLPASFRIPQTPLPPSPLLTHPARGSTSLVTETN